MKEFDYKLKPGQKLLKNSTLSGIVPLVSIITPFYNAGKSIEETAASVLNQTFPYFEWIIVNDGSTDEESINELSLLQKKDNRIRVLNKENGGIASARNLAIKDSKADIIIPLDADDLIEPTFVECIYWSLYCNPGATWSYTDSLGFGQMEYLWKRKFDSNTMKTENIITYASGIRKKDLLEVGCYDEVEKHYNEDWRLWLKFISKGKYPVHMSWYGFWYRRTDSGVLSLVRNDENRQKRAKQLIEEVARNIKKEVKAIEFPQYGDKESFVRPHKWKWDYKLENNNNKINILMIIPNMTMGGANVFNLDLISGLSSEKYSITIITTEEENNELRQEFGKYTSDIFELSTFLCLDDWSAFIHYLIQSRQINTLFISNSYYGYYLLPYLKKEYPKLAITDYVHSETWYWRNGGYARNSSVNSYLIDKTFVCTEHLKEVLINECNHNSNVQTLYIGVDENKFDKSKFIKGSIKHGLGIDDKSKVVLFVCRLESEKRPMLMIQIAKTLINSDKNIHFFVVGDGSYLNDLKKSTKTFNINNNVHFFGYQESSIPYYVDSDVTLICSIKEGLALTAYESLSMGNPVVTSDVGGQKELIDSTVGKVVPLMQDEKKDFNSNDYDNKEINSYVDAIKEIIYDESKLSNMSKACRIKIEERFSKKKMIELIEKEFLDLYMLKMNNNYEDKNLIKDMSFIIDDYYTIYCEFLKKEIEAMEIWKSRTWFKQLAESYQNNVNVLKDLPPSNDFAIQELQQIYNMRTWRLIQKYRRFMDNSLLGKFLCKVRNIILKITGRE